MQPLRGGGGRIAHPSTNPCPPSTSSYYRNKLKSPSRGRCSSSRRRCPTAAAPSLVLRPRPSWGSSRRRTPGARRATRRPWWARRLMVMVFSSSSSQQPPPPLLTHPAWSRGVASRPAIRRAARAAGASGRRGGRRRRAGGARTRPAGLGAGEGARGPVGRLRSRGARRGGAVSVPVGVAVMVMVGALLAL